MKLFSTIARILTVCMLVTYAGSAAAQPAYPNKPIRFIVPFSPGGSSETLVRQVGQMLTDRLGQQVIIDNRPGGNTVIGHEALVKSPPDGYTILLSGSAHIINSLLLHNLPYDSFKDFAPLATLIRTQFVLVLHPSVPANNLQEFIALAKSKPGQLSYATSGVGTGPHMQAEFFNSMVGTRMLHIPYKGGGQYLSDIIGGRVQLAFSVPIALLPHIKSGKLKAIAVTGATRLSRLPEVPTFAEAGLPGFDLKGWQGIFVPARTPKPIIGILAAEIATILAVPEVKDKLAGQGQDPFISTPEQFAELMNADLARYTKIIKDANIKVEN